MELEEPAAAPPPAAAAPPGEPALPPPLEAPDYEDGGGSMGSASWWDGFALTVCGKKVSNEEARNLIYGLATLSAVLLCVLAAVALSPDDGAAAGPGAGAGLAATREGDVIQGYAHTVFNGQDWYLVRRSAGSEDPSGGKCWHPAEDNLAGTDAYGRNDANPAGQSTFSVPFAELPWTQMLLASADMSIYAVLARDQVEQCSGPLLAGRVRGVDGDWLPALADSSLSSGQGCGDDASWRDERTGDGCPSYATGNVAHRYCSMDRDTNGQLAQDACTLSCDSCSTATGPPQSCRRDQPADPWISVGGRSVYAEGGWCARTWGDETAAAAAGGANVWVNAVASSDGAAALLPTFEVTSGLASQKFDGQTWYLVRRDAAVGDACRAYAPACWDASRANCWQLGSDSLAGSDAPRGVNDLNPMGEASFSVSFDQYQWTHMMLASGDMSGYRVIDRAALGRCCGNPGPWGTVGSGSGTCASRSHGGLNVWINSVEEGAGSQPQSSDDLQIVDGRTYYIREARPRPLTSSQALAVTAVPNDYAVSFDLTPNADVVDSWGSIVHFTASGADCCGCASAFYLTYFADSMSLVFASAPDFV